MAVQMDTHIGAFPGGPQWNPSVTAPQAEQLPPFYKTFLKGQPKALGTVQISVALLQAALGAVLIYTINAYTSVSVYSGVPFWGALFFIISGSLTVAAENKQSTCLIRGSLAMHIFSILASLSGIILIIIDFAYTLYFNYGPCYSTPCSLFQDTILVIRWIVLFILLITDILQFTLSISVSVFSGRSLKQKSAEQPQQVFILPNEYRIAENPTQNPGMAGISNLQEMNPQLFNPSPYKVQQ